MKPTPIVIHVVEDDAFYGSLLAHHLSLNPDHLVKKFTSAKTFLAALHEKPDIVTLDYSLPDGTGDYLLSQVKELSPESKVIFISGQNDIKIAIDLLRRGVHDYIVKDNDTKERLWISIEHLRETIELKKELDTLKKEVVKKYDFQKVIIGNSEPIRQMFHWIDKASKTNITVSITGETGTGKELVAKSIHFNSQRKKEQFIAVNVAAIPRDLLESELFGHEKGAFTGAAGRRIGKFEEAHKGTLFLDEIGEMDLSLQAKLLRVLQEKEITRVGSNQVVPIDVRIIVATHKNLLHEVKNGRFREDLYYRLLGLPIQVPPLRDRNNDIILIARFFIDQFCRENSLPDKNLSVEAKKKLMLYNFPGNIRELKSVVELACVMCDEMEIQPEHINIISASYNVNTMNGENTTLRDFTTKLIQHYLDLYQYDILKVAEKLDIGKSTIYRMIKNNELVVQKVEN
ncbi:sigma-54-dependent transcriptional regulator [Foetidibacter luteolus]|uniref:sigma-54-dependent transcriptional regulator n=1 Tax=Foetidibacter luteolus TaxID=2608880 RepID=UPI00129ACD51|nr:sigma-54 dependent transcriptional regulator [Foetidibacter luteolus]